MLTDPAFASRLDPHNLATTGRTIGALPRPRALGGAFFEVTAYRVATPSSLPFSSSRLSFPRARP